MKKRIRLRKVRILGYFAILLTLALTHKEEAEGTKKQILVKKAPQQRGLAALKAAPAMAALHQKISRTRP